MGAFIKFMRGTFKLPIIWQVWVLALVVVNGIAPLFFFDQLVAVLTFTGFMTGVVVGMVLVEVHGFTKLLGLMHAPWIPVFLLQIFAYPTVAETSYTIWLRIAVVVTGASLIVDIYDVIQYLGGHREDRLQEA